MAFLPFPSPSLPPTVQFGNRSVAFIKAAVAAKKPFFAYIGTTGPHLPSIPAPWHLDEVAAWGGNTSTSGGATGGDANKHNGREVTAPRTPNFNQQATSHHPTIAALPSLGENEHFVDQHYRDRLGTLLSIDDLVAGVVKTLEDLGVLDNTYILYSSDHGYHLGQWRLPMEKMWPYETDIRIPFYMRGPGIAPGTVLSDMGMNLDIPATLLDLAGIAVPAKYDGQSLAPMVIGSEADKDAARSSWRTRTVISFAEGAFQSWGGTDFSPGLAPDAANPPQATIHPPQKADNGVDYTFDNPQNQWRMLRVVNSTHDIACKFVCVGSVSVVVAAHWLYGVVLGSSNWDPISRVYAAVSHAAHSPTQHFLSLSLSLSLSLPLSLSLTHTHQ